MSWIYFAVLGWIAISAFNIRELFLSWLGEFGRVTRGDMAFFVMLGSFGPFCVPLPLAYFIRRKTNFRFDWDKPIATKQRR